MIEIAYHFIANHANHATTPSRPQRPPRLRCFPCPVGHLEVFNYGPCIFPFTAQRALAVSLLLHNVRLLEDFIKWVNDCDCERKDQRYFERKLANQITFSNVICDCDLAQKKWLWIPSDQSTTTYAMGFLMSRPNFVTTWGRREFRSVIAFVVPPRGVTSPLFPGSRSGDGIMTPL